MGCRTPEEVHDKVEREAEVAPEIQDDFDIKENELTTLDVAERPENQVYRLSIYIHSNLMIGG